MNVISQDKEGFSGSEKDIAPNLKPADLTESSSGHETVTKQEGMGNLLSEGGDEGLSEASSIVAPHKHISHKVESTTEDSTIETFKSPEVKQEGEVLPVSKEIKTEPIYEPAIVLPPEFPLRPYWQDDGLVYDFLVSGLDYEDASYLKIGFENLLQVGSDSVANALWSFHPSILLYVDMKSDYSSSQNTSSLVRLLVKGLKVVDSIICKWLSCPVQ